MLWMPGAAEGLDTREQIKGFFFLVVVFNSLGYSFSLAVCLRNQGEGEWKGTWKGGSVVTSSCALAGVQPPATTVGHLQTPVTPEPLSSGLRRHCMHVCVYTHTWTYIHIHLKTYLKKLA